MYFIFYLYYGPTTTELILKQDARIHQQLILFAMSLNNNIAKTTTIQVPFTNDNEANYHKANDVKIL